MELVVHGSKPRLEHVGVDLGRRQVRVAEHHLDGPQVGAALQEMRREGMPQDVRAEVARIVLVAGFLIVSLVVTAILRN